MVSEMSRMYDEGFLEGAAMVARDGDLLAEAYRRLTRGVGVGSMLAREVNEAYQEREKRRQAAVHDKQTQAAPSPDYGTAEKPFGSLDPSADSIDALADWIPAEAPACCVFVDTAGIGKCVLEHLRGLGIRAQPLPKVTLSEPPLCRAERKELYQWRSMFSRPDICRRTLDQLREARDELRRRLETVRGAVLR